MAIRGVRAIQAVTRLGQLHAEKEAQIEQMMEEFGEAVTAAENTEAVRRLSFQIEQVQSEVARIEEATKVVEQKHALADAYLQEFGLAVEEHKPQQEQSLLSLKVEAARLEAENEEVAQLKQVKGDTEVARNLAKLKAQAQKHEAAMRAQAEAKPTLQKRRASRDATAIDRQRRHSGPTRPAAQNTRAARDALRTSCVSTRSVRGGSSGRLPPTATNSKKSLPLPLPR